jgi:hypothetical protein
MTKLLEQGIEAVRALPEERQDTAGKLLLTLAGMSSDEYELTAEQLADLDAAIAEVDRGEFASDEEVAAMWKKLGR